MIAVPLASLVSLAGKRAGTEIELPIYSVTKHAGFVPSLEYFKKQVFSRDVEGYKLVEPGDFAYATIHLDEGSIGIAPEHGLISPMYTVFKTDDARVDPRYLIRFLRSPRALAHYPHLGKGAVHRRKAISLAALGTLPVPLPALHEQRRIAATLDQADALRAKRQRYLTLLEDVRQSIFLEMFGDPVRNECNWPTKAFGDVCQTRLGKMLDAKQQTGAHSRPYLRNANVQWFRLELDDVLEMDFDEKSRAALRLHDGDLLICEGGHPGRAAVWRGELKDCYYQKALHRARPYPGIALSDFLAQLLWFVVHRGGLKDHVTSSTIAHLTGAKLKAMPIILPGVTIQAEFVRRIQGLEKYRAVISAQNSVLHELLSSLEARVFSDGLQPNLPSECSPGG